MAGRETSEYWKGRARQVHAYNNGRLSLREIEAKLQTEAWPEGAGAPPTASTIRTILKNTPDIGAYFPAQWPESFGNPDLPWEAAPAFFALWRHLDRRPSVRLARAFWRVTLAAGPDVPVDSRYRLAAFSLNYDPRVVEECIRVGEFNVNASVPMSVEEMESGRGVTLFQDIIGEMTPEQVAAHAKGLAIAADYLKWRSKND